MNKISLSASSHPIKSVTIFKSSKAEVVREFPVDLKHGQNKIEIRGLSGSIDTESVRISGLQQGVRGASAGPRLLDVVCTVAPATSGPFKRDDSVEGAIVRVLRAKRTALEGEKSIRGSEASLLQKYADTLTGEHVNPAQIGSFVDGYVQRLRKIQEAVAALDEEIRKIDNELEEQTKRTSDKQGTTNGQVDVVILAEFDGPVNLNLTYIVGDVAWEPTYELHAESKNGKPSPTVSLHYRARITQRTGEDWDDTSLNLSTVTFDPTVRQIPTLYPLKIRQRAAHGGLFGPGPKPVNANNNAGGGLFGNVGNVATNAQPFGGFGGFGQPQQQQQQQQQQQALQLQQQQRQQALQLQQQQPLVFGAAPPAPQPSTTLFGQPAQPAPVTTGSALFGGGGFGTVCSAVPAPNPAPPQFRESGSLFGSAPPAPNPTFGSAAPASSSSAFGAFSSTSAIGDDFESISHPDPPAETSAPLTTPNTIVNQTPVAFSFSVHGKSTIPSDGAHHQVSIALLEFDSTISYVVAPKIDARVYLECRVKNSSEYRLLPGPVSVILDGSYVSKASIPEVNTGGSFTCTLGTDSSFVKVSYSRTSKTIKSQGGAFSEQFTTTTYTTTIKVHNTHPFSLDDLIVKDIIHTTDLSDSKRVKVLLRKPEGLADAGSNTVTVNDDGGRHVSRPRVRWDGFGGAGEKEGRFQWLTKVEAGETKVLVSEWDVKVPDDGDWIESVFHFRPGGLFGAKGQAA